MDISSGRDNQQGSGFQDILAQLGLTAQAIEQDGGKQAASTIISALGRLMDLTNTSSVQRVELATAIAAWQASAQPQHRKEGFKNGYFKLFYTMEYLLCQPDDEIVANYAYGMQVPALLLAQMLANEVATTSLSDMGEQVLVAFVEMLSSLLDAKIRLVDDTNDTVHTDDSVTNVNSPTGARTSAVQYLVHCIPKEVDNPKQLKVCVGILFRLLNACAEAPALRSDILRHIESISVDNDNDNDNANTSGTGKSAVWLEYVPDMLAAVKQGHSEFKALIKKNKALCTAKSRELENHLADMVDALGFDELEGLLQDLADLEPRKLVKSLPVFVTQLASAAMKHKYLILGLLLAVALVLGAGPLAPLLTSVAGVCSVTPELFVPFFKLLTSIAASGGDELAMQCLSMVAKIAKSGLVSSPADQAALLEAINILKDSCKYSNLFHADTLKVLQGFSAANPAVFKNIVTWNAGKTAKKGNQKDFLVTAGQLPATATATAVVSVGAVTTETTASTSAGSTTSFRSVAILSRWFSPKKTASTSATPTGGAAESGTGTTIASPQQATSPPVYGNTYTSPGTVKSNSVMPSPQSQSLAVLQQQLAAQQQQLHQQMLLMQQLQYQEQMQLQQMQQQQNGVGSQGEGQYQFLVPMPGTNNAGTTGNGYEYSPYPYASNVGQQPQMQGQAMWQPQSQQGPMLQHHAQGPPGLVSPTGMLYLNPPQTPDTNSNNNNMGVSGPSTAYMYPYNSSGVVGGESTQYAPYQASQGMGAPSYATVASHAPAKQLFPADQTPHHQPHQAHQIHASQPVQHNNQQSYQSHQSQLQTDTHVEVRDAEEVLTFTENRTHTKKVGFAPTEPQQHPEDNKHGPHSSHAGHIVRNNAVAPATTTTGISNTAAAPVDAKKGSTSMVGAVVHRLRRPSSVAAKSGHSSNNNNNGGTITESKVVQVAPHLS